MGDDGSVSFRFVNDTRESLRYGPCLWFVLQRTAEGWEPRQPQPGYFIGKSLPAASERTFTLRIGVPAGEEGGSLPDVAVGSLPAGEHFLGVEATSPDDDRVLYLAPFDVSGDDE